jgi:DnaJ-domain-containing protein 1
LDIGKLAAGHIKALNPLCSDTDLERFLRGDKMHRASFAFGASDFRGTRPINLDGSGARSFERHRLRQRSLVGANVFCGVRRTLRRVGWQTIVLAFVLLDIAGLGFTLVASVWLAAWMTINVAALMIGALSWSEDRRLQRESAIARERVRAAERRNLEERQREAQRQQEAERLRQAEQLREAERRRRQEEKEREAQRQRQREREQSTTQSKTEWWSVLEVTPTANKDEIVRNYRRKIQQCHPDRVAGLSPEFLPLAEAITKALNVAYEQAIRACR